MAAVVATLGLAGYAEEADPVAAHTVAAVLPR